MQVTHLILKNLIHNEEYARSTLPYLKPKYFDDHVEQIVYEQIDEFITKYNSLPTREALVIELDNRKGMSEKDFSGCGAYIGTLIDDEKEDKDWLVNTTEKFCQEKALYNAIMDSIAIIDGNEEGQDKGAIPEILSEALSVSFDPNVGHDFIDDADARYEFYHRTEERVPFDIEYLNKITKGGLPKKSLTVLMAGTGVGKSLAMCHFASANVLDGKNVLYITMEMAEERIAERIDANLLNIKLDALTDIPKMIYQKKIAKVKGKTSGKMVVKEYPTSSAGVGHFRHLLNELKLKKGFVPDIIYIDYLNICMSSRMKMGASVNSYTYVKAIAEEIRGLAVESDVPIVTATQVNRTGYGDSDFGLEDTSESFGLPATTDLMLALISTEEMEAIDQILIKQLKNRYGDPGTNKRFVVGIDRPKMRLYDVESNAQLDLMGGTKQEPHQFNKTIKIGDEKKSFGKLKV